MKKLTAIALAAALFVSGPALVIAQDAAPADPAAAATVTAPADFNGFVTGLGAADFASSIALLGSASTVNVVKISSLAGAEGQASALDQAIAPKAEDIKSLQAQIETSDAAKKALEAQGVTPDKVVGIMASADGAVTLYVDDLA